MCGTCGCGKPGPNSTHGHHHDHGDGHHHEHNQAREIELGQSILSFNDRLAEQNRGYFRAKGLTVINLMSGPGSGKTSLIEETIRRIGGDIALATIVGDLDTENDAQRMRDAGGEAVQITTGEVCHLDAHMVQHALERVSLADLQLLLIENVGNLVCPASFDLGESARVVLLSATEGEDKPLKYPVMFSRAHFVLLTKMDLAEAVDFDREAALENVRKAAPGAEVLEVSAKSGQGMEAWLAWLQARLPQRVSST